MNFGCIREPQFDGGLEADFEQHVLGFVVDADNIGKGLDSRADPA